VIVEQVCAWEGTVWAAAWANLVQHCDSTWTFKSQGAGSHIDSTVVKVLGPQPQTDCC
jgi:hypothetical protein